MVPATTSLTGFSGETAWPLGQLRLLVTIGDVTHSTKAWMNFMVVKSLSSYNGASSGKPREERTHSANFTVALHPNFPDQEVVVRGSLSDRGRTELCALLKKNLDIFAWQPSDMTGVPRSVAELRLNIREGCPPVRQKKRGQASERAKAIQAEVQKLVEARIMREVYYHDWLSNPVMVKKHDGSWRMNGQAFDITALDSAVRANTSESSKMMRLITDLSREFSELKCQNRKAEKLSRWKAWVRGRIPNSLRFQEEPSIHIAPVPRTDDPYVMVRDAARGTREDEDVDTAAPWDTQLPEGATRAEGPARDPVTAPIARECSFASFMKCGPTQFYETEGAVGLIRWFKKMENTFEISECAEVRKVKFSTATLHGRALTWWNSQVATLGHEVANARSRAEVKQMMTGEFCPTEEVQRLEDELRHLKLRDINIAAYTERFNELALLCPE
nr:reverse transcriptase domain-containing protein [Tanacetum cinerariifolium]